jgi:hypothetical protein
VSPSGFDWSDAAVGGTFGLVVALVGNGAILIVQRRRHTLTPGLGLSGRLVSRTPTASADEGGGSSLAACASSSTRCRRSP